MRSCAHKVPIVCCQMPTSKMENNCKENPDGKMKIYRSMFIFHADTIYKISGF